MSKTICFVMMPFGNPYDEYYSEIYLQAIEKSGLVPKRADSLYRPSPILHDIWEFINDSALVIADITGRNPNVMYELGLAHAIAKPAIIISDNIDDVPFDLRALRILLYDVKKPNWSLQLENAIQSAIKEITISPIEAVLPTFIKVRPSKQDEVSDLKRDLVEIKQYLYKIDEDLMSQSANKDESIVLDRDQYTKAIKYAHDLYFSGGLDLAELKEAIVYKYGVTYQAASDILDLARNK
jgi:hypothetical protein